MKTILIVDDHPLVFGGLKGAASLQPELKLQFEQARTVAEARRRIRKNPLPDLTLLDIHLGDTTGFTLVEEFVSEGQEFPFAILTASRDWNYLNKAMTMGARGFLLKDAESEEIVSNIERILSGKFIFPESAGSVRKVSDDLVRLFHTLTDREKEVLKHIQAGLMNREVAERLGIGLRTVETHRANACEKLAVQNTVQLSSILNELKHLL